MLTHQFIDILKQPSAISTQQLNELEVILNEYPFFESAHLLYAKALHQHNSVNYNKQLRKTAIVVNSRKVLYDLIHLKQTSTETLPDKDLKVNTQVAESQIRIEQSPDSVNKTLNPVTLTNSDIKIIYINTPVSKVEETENIKAVSKENFEKTESFSDNTPADLNSNQELNFIKAIENETENQDINDIEAKLNKEIELEISKGIVQSYIETDVIKTPELDKEENKEPVSFTDWLNKVKKEAGTIQIDTKSPESKKEPENRKKEEKSTQKEQKSAQINQNRQIIDKIIEADPGRIKLGTTKFFTPNTEAKQSLLENEHLVTETLAKIYALQGNISKAIRAYEILSLKFPQKSVYFASLIEKLKTNK